LARDARIPDESVDRGFMKKSLARLVWVAFCLLWASSARAGSVRGRLIDATGNPIAGASVQCFPYRDADQTLLDQMSGKDPAALGEIKTDTSGNFRLPLEKPGVEVGLLVRPAGLSSVRFEGPFDAGEDTDLFDIPVPAAQKVAGSVVDESGKPISGARVIARGSEALAGNDAVSFSETRTLPDGTFSMPDAPPGPRILTAIAAGYVRSPRIQMEARADERLVLRPGGTIRGVLRDASGQSVAGTIVVAGELAAQTDSAGRFEISGAPPGTEDLRVVWKDDFAARADGIRVKKGEASNVDLKLARAASIAGTVVEEKTKRPIAGARVTASVAAAGPFRRRGLQERTARTDAHGRFRLGGLASHPYSVEASKDGYLASTLPNLATSVVRSGTANLALRRAASLAGKIVDEKGEPISGARVSVAQEFNLRMIRRRGLAAAAQAILAGGALSGTDGSFRLRNIAPEHNLELEASKSGFATARQPGITLKSGDAVAGISLVLRKGLAARGRVVDGSGKPIAGAQIWLVFQESGGGRGAQMELRLLGMERQKPDTVSGPDGGFAVGGLSAGRYAAVVSRDGFARKSVAALEVKAQGENVWPPIALAPGVALAGMVRDSTGLAIPGAQILVVDPGGGGRTGDTSSGPDGKFAVGGLTAEHPVMLNVSAQGYAAAQREATPPAQDLAIVLKSSATIRGRVEDADAKTPLTDFTVGTRSGGGNRFVVQVGGAGGDHAFHSDDGTFELGDVAPGKWTVHVTASGYRPADVSGVEVAEGAVREGVVFSLKKGGGLSGRVLDPQQGTGVPNASVSYQSSGSGGMGGGAAFLRLGGASNSSTTTDADGRFSFDGLPDGKIQVTASHPDFLDVTQEVDLSKQSTADLTLGTGGSIAGSVVGQDGRSPIPGAQVSLNPEGDAAMRFGSGDATRADGSGGFLFDHLQAGRYQLMAQSSDGKTINQEVSLADGQRLTGVLLQMASGTLLQGTVSGLPAGQLGGVRVSASAANYSDSTTTDDGGNFTLHNVPSGAVRLNAATSFVSGRSTSTSIVVPDGAPQFSAQIVFQGASRLSGRVSRGDAPLPGIFVNAIPLDSAVAAGGGRASGQTDDNGQYALEGLSDGDYSVNLSGQGVGYRRNFTVSGDTPGDIALPPIQLAGTATESGSGEPLDSVTVQMQAQTPAGASTGGRFGAMKMATADSTGHYFIDDVDPGTYQVTARRDEYQASTQTVTIGGDSATLNFALQRGEGVSIRVADGLTGIPLRGVIASAVDGTGAVTFQGSISLDSTGKGEIGSLAPGQYVVHVFSDGYAARAAVVTAPSPLVTVALTPGGRLEVAAPAAWTGRLVDSTGLPYSTGPFRSDGRINGSAPVAAWEHLAPGSYQLMVGSQGGEAPFPFTVVEGQTTRLNLASSQ
jgi:protocatechuate 3,4-dioxygenase beta subunit